jgi:hypothetical protein
MEIFDNIQTKNPAVLFSGGRDSAVLLAMLLMAFGKDKLRVIQFRSDFTPQQKRYTNELMKLWDFSIMSFQPSNRFLIPSGDGLALVDDYRLNGEILPVVRDFVHNSKICGLELSEFKTPDINYPFDVTFVGWRKTDDFSLLGDFQPPKEVVIGGSRFYAPLYDLSDEDIAECQKFFNVPFDDFYESKDPAISTNSIVACHNCISNQSPVFCPKSQETIPNINWDKQGNLDKFQQRFRG